MDLDKHRNKKGLYSNLGSKKLTATTTSTLKYKHYDLNNGDDDSFTWDDKSNTKEIDDLDIFGDKKKKKGGIANMFSKGLKREKNIIGWSNQKRKKEDQMKARGIGEKINKAKNREKNGYKEIEEQIVGKTNIAKNVEMKMEAEDAIMENVVICPEGCGRSFGQKALIKHIKVCKKVFQSKRKEFDTTKKRVIDKEQKLGIRKGKKRAPSKNRNNPLKKKWKKDSEKLRQIVKKKNDRIKKNTTVQDFDLGDVLCEYCGKEFTEKGMERHKPICKSKNKHRKN